MKRKLSEESADPEYLNWLSKRKKKKINPVTRINYLESYPPDLLQDNNLLCTKALIRPSVYSEQYILDCIHDYLIRDIQANINTIDKLKLSYNPRLILPRYVKLDHLKKLYFLFLKQKIHTEMISNEYRDFVYQFDSRNGGGGLDELYDFFILGIKRRSSIKSNHFIIHYIKTINLRFVKHIAYKYMEYISQQPRSYLLELLTLITTGYENINFYQDDTGNIIPMITN
jgi:hypothetical protein